MSKVGSWTRRLRFFVLRRFVLPVAIVPFLYLIRSWRRRGSDALLAAFMASPRLILATYHGMMLHLLAFSDVPVRCGRRPVVMVSPSLDGGLLAAALEYFGIDHVRGTISSRSIAGSLEFIRRVEAGGIGVLATDGPRGPCCQARVGFLRIASAARANIALTVTSASRGLPFGSWDRAHLPLPFARVEVMVQLSPVPKAGDEDRLLTEIEQQLLNAARQLNSPVLPPALRDRGSGFEQLTRASSGDASRSTVRDGAK